MSQEQVLGCRDPPPSACGQACLTEQGGRCMTKAPSQQHHSPPLPTAPLPSSPSQLLRHSSAGRYGWKSWHRDPAPMCRDLEQGHGARSITGIKLFTAWAWHSQPR